MAELKPFHTETMAVLSTGHTKENELNVIIQGIEDGKYVGFTREYGPLINIIERHEDYAKLPTIHQAITLSRLVGCDWILFDRDGPITELLPLYNW